MWPIKALFRDIVPTINNYISAKHHIQNINYYYLEQLLPQKQEVNMSVHPFALSDALDVIYNIQIVEDNNGENKIIWGKELLPYMNKRYCPIKVCKPLFFLSLYLKTFKRRNNGTYTFANFGNSFELHK